MYRASADYIFETGDLWKEVLSTDDTMTIRTSVTAYGNMFPDIGFPVLYKTYYGNDIYIREVCTLCSSSISKPQNGNIDRPEIKGGLPCHVSNRAEPGLLGSILLVTYWEMRCARCAFDAKQRQSRGRIR